MFRWWRAPLLAAMVVAGLFATTPTASAMVRGRVFVGGGWYGPGWGWGWGPGWYVPWWGAYYPGFYYGPLVGHVKIDTPDKAAWVFVDGGYVGTVAEAKKFPLRPGIHDVELRDPSGRTFFQQRVQVSRGHTTQIHPPHAG